MNVLRFRKKPVVIEALQYTPESREAVIEWCGARYRFMDDDGCLQEWTYLGIQTLEGEMKACPGDWIIKGVKGEFYPCKPDIFEATYEPVGATIEVRASGPYVVADPNASASPPGDDEYGLAKDYEQMADHLPPGWKL